MELNVFTLVYSSEPTVFFNDNDIQQLLIKSRAWNRRMGISGALVYTGFSFVQLLEGEEAMVRYLYDQICKDDRHENVSIVHEEFRSGKAFPDHPMDFDFFMGANQRTRFSMSPEEIFAQSRFGEDEPMCLIAKLMTRNSRVDDESDVALPF